MHHGEDILRIGILCESLIMPEWQAESISNLSDLPYVTLYFLVLDNPEYKSSRLSSSGSGINKNLYHFYNKRILNCKKLRKNNFYDRDKTTPSLAITFSVDPDGFLLPSHDDIPGIVNLRLDVIVNLSKNKPGKKILNIPRYGLWSYRFNNDDSYTFLSTFWRFYHGHETSNGRLIKYTGNENNGVVLRSGYFKTIGYSYSRHIDQLLAGSSNWLKQACIDLKNDINVYENIKSSTSKDKDNSSYPSIFQISFFLSRIAKNLLKEVAAILFRHEKWNIGIMECPIQSFISPGRMPEIKWLPQQKNNRFIADPFGFVFQGNIYVAAEEFDYCNPKGKISVIAINDKNTLSKPETVIKLPAHMSYPYILEYQGDTYCIPETYENNNVALYIAEELPLKWKRVTTLIEDFSAVDSTIFQHNGYWWLFCTNKNTDPNNNLYIWYSEKLAGPYKSHANNPVKTDIRSARPGGTPFYHDGNLYRPAQDCTINYGRRVAINRIDVLNKIEFSEETVSVIEPDTDCKYRNGLHTISSVGNVTLIDGKYHKLSLCALRGALLWIMSSVYRSLKLRMID